MRRNSWEYFERIRWWVLIVLVVAFVLLAVYIWLFERIPPAEGTSGVLWESTRLALVNHSGSSYCIR